MFVIAAVILYLFNASAVQRDESADNAMQTLAADLAVLCRKFENLLVPMAETF